MKADLQPQRVARPETGRQGAAAHQLIPQRWGVGGGEQQLHPVLAGVAGAAHQHPRATHHPLRDGHARRQWRIGDRLHDFPRAGALHGEHRVVIQAVAHLRVEPTRMLAPPLQIARVVGGVGHRQEALCPEPVGEEIVEHPPILRGTTRRTARRPRGSRRHRWRAAAAAAPARPGRRFRSRPCARRRRSRSPRAPPCARRARRRTAPASPSRRTRPSSRQPRHGGRTGQCGAGNSARPAGYRAIGLSLLFGLHMCRPPEGACALRRPHAACGVWPAGPHAALPGTATCGRSPADRRSAGPCPRYLAARSPASPGRPRRPPVIAIVVGAGVVMKNLRAVCNCARLSKS